MTDWKRVQGSQDEKPVEFDTTTSTSVVYQRKDIERVTVKNSDGSKTELWEYDEREMTHEEYVETMIGRNRADIDFLSAMTGVEL